MVKLFYLSLGPGSIEKKKKEQKRIKSIDVVDIKCQHTVSNNLCIRFDWWRAQSGEEDLEEGSVSILNVIQDISFIKIRGLPRVSTQFNAI